MPTFPVLSTGALAQYPLSRISTYSTDVIQFVDGSQQRCQLRGKLLRQWQVSLSLLNESELFAMEQFFESVQGNFGLFTFIDPISNQSVPNCRLQNPEIVTQYLAAHNGGVVIQIEETNG